MVANGSPAEAAPALLPFSERFVQRVAKALDAGRVGFRSKRAASLLELSVDELADVLRGYGLEPTFEP